MELKDAVIAIRGTLKRDPKELQAAWLTISEHFASIEQPKMADMYVTAWRRERADEIGLIELTDRDLKESWQLGRAVGCGRPSVRTLVESECPAATPEKILKWLRNRNKPAAEPVEPTEEVQRQMAPVETQDGREELRRIAHNARIELKSALTELALYHGVTLGNQDANSFETYTGWCDIRPIGGETWEEACTERVNQGDLIGYAEGIAVRILVDRVRCKVRRQADGTATKVVAIINEKEIA